MTRPARAGAAGPVFTAGTGDMTQLIEGLPALVRAVRVNGKVEPIFVEQAENGPNSASHLEQKQSSM